MCSNPAFRTESHKQPKWYKPTSCITFGTNQTRPRPICRSSTMSLPGSPEGQMSPEVAQFIQRESQVAQVQQMIATLTDVCWDKCVTNPGSYLSGKETSCLENCTKRFVESTQYIMQRAQHKAGGGQGGDMFQ